MWGKNQTKVEGTRIREQNNNAGLKDGTTKTAEANGRENHPPCLTPSLPPSHLPAHSLAHGCTFPISSPSVQQATRVVRCDARAASPSHSPLPRQKGGWPLANPSRLGIHSIHHLLPKSGVGGWLTLSPYLRGCGEQGKEEGKDKNHHHLFVSRVLI